MSAVPVEVCEVIIDYVALESTAPVPSGLAPQYQFRRRYMDLVYCALTCRAWLPRSRYHLSTRTFINSRQKLERTTKFLKANPSMAALIRDLYICSPPRPYVYDHDSHSFTHWTHLIALRLSGIIPALNKLVLVDLNWRFLHPSFFVVAPQLTSTVTTLWIYSLSLSNPGRLTALLSMFSSLQNLDLVNVIFDSARRSDSGLRKAADLPNLQRVRLKRTVHLESVLSWLSPRARSLRSLAVDVHTPYQPLRELLLQLPLLSELHLSFARSPGTKFDDFIGNLNFSRLHSLHSLAVRAENDSIAALARPLSTMNGAALNTVALHLQPRMITVYQSVAGATPGWASLDEELSKLAKLKNITMHLKAPEGDYPIQDLLPRAHKRGIVNVTPFKFEE
ncbi:uncharacterized protein PHACADRAFT_170587 [Phanerochaete carnosa HHB-10118-sp]|uniref:F-box domain-containing protein n=1 Tax=Phanerochaete carnosa (strain HHB-10118-sp) TaxID=650164 RepID=K5VAV5_PHACS|nr:uncharacterized protein PHACADRAFT_170587 [Phanerochaete carnosa HHB-10118-sp]EKM60001.1 hypothetical protein PHACADRAFT_170587 [Phanerochaete carnosa HHB-10118-sp]